MVFFFFSSRRRHTSLQGDWSSDVCSSDLRLAYPWHDNFCERRSYYVGQCPGGFGHQGQDIRAADCNPKSEGEDRCSPRHNEVVAVRGGAILRAPAQEAVYLIVNT